MGLLSRWRGNPPSDPPVAEVGTLDAPDAPETVAPSAPAPTEVISAATLAQVPEWVKVPPPQPLLPPMPVVVEQRFDYSLASWQPPEMFLEDLGHAVSGAAPSGIVEATARPMAEPVVHAEPMAEPPTSSADLTLAALPPLTTPGRAPQAQVRRLAWADDEPQIRTVPTVEGVTPSPDWATLPNVPAAEPAVVAASVSEPAAEFAPQEPEVVVDLVGASPTPTGPDLAPPVQPVASEAAPAQPLADLPLAPAVEPPRPAMEGDRPFGDTPTSVVVPDEPVSELVGSAPLAPPPQPLVDPSPPPRPFNRLIQAPTPSDMPLANLPSSLIPRPVQAQVTRTLPQESAEADPEPVVTESANPPLPNRAPVDAPPVSAAATAAAPASAPAPGPQEPTAALVGDRPITDQPVEEPVSGAVSVPLIDTSAEPSAADLPLADLPLADLPLAGPTPGPSGSPAVTTQRLVPEVPEPTATRPEVAAAAVEPEPPREAPTEYSPAPPGVAPLVGAAPPIAGETPPISSSAAPASGERAASAPAAPETPLAGPRRPAQVRSGLGQPMSELPSTARSWDITSMSREQQLRTSRELMQRQMASYRATAAQYAGARPASAAAPPPDLTLPTPQPAPPRGPQTVHAGSPLPVARVESFGPAPTGEVFDDLPPYGEQTAPLVSLAPPLDGDIPEPTPAPSSSEGSRVRTALGQRAGVDLSNVPVDRSPTAAAEVRRLGARAMTTERGISIPPEVGTLDSGPGEAVFAHELTHVVQRARLGTTLPPEFTSEGRQLEAEALSTEMTFRASAPLPLLPVERGTDRVPPGGQGFGGGPSESGIEPDLPLAGPTGGPDEETIVQSIMNRMSTMAMAPMGGPITEEVTSANVMSSLGTPMLVGAPMMAGAAAGAPSSPMGASVQRAQELPEATQNPVVAPPTQDGEVNPFANRPSDEDLDRLSYWLYPLIRYRLKGELREDRERAGLLTDNYRRW